MSAASSESSQVLCITMVLVPPRKICTQQQRGQHAGHNKGRLLMGNASRELSHVFEHQHCS
jgi:hypothetical protein